MFSQFGSTQRQVGRRNGKLLRKTRNKESAAFPQYHLEAGTFAIAGMGALLAASIRAPLTGIILVLEMTDNYQLILPMIITGLGATLLAQFTGGKPLYSAILARTLAKQEAEQLARSKAASASENT